jgi:hypothetical protein
MAFINYRLDATNRAVNTADTITSTGLTNQLIDNNFFTLDSRKVDKDASGNVSIGGTLTVTGALTASGNLTVTGNLTVNGTTTTVNSTTVSVDDKNIELGSIASPTDATADGGGITLKGASDKTFNWLSNSSAWTSSENIALAAGKTLILNGATSGSVTLSVPANSGVAGSTKSIVFPATAGTVVTTGDTGTVSTTMLADLGVTTDKIANLNVTTGKIADTAVTEGKIANGAVNTSKLADGAVGVDKIADNAVSTNKINGNAVTTAKIADLNVTTAKIADAAVATAKIADGAVTNAKIADAAVDAVKISNGNVTTAKIADNAVTTAKIADGNVTTAKIADANVTTDKIANGNVTTLKIADLGVTTAKIADGNVTTAKLSDIGTAGTYSSVTVDAKGRVTAGSNPGYLTAEADTLASVTLRGATTATAITLGSGIATSYTYFGGTSVNWLTTSAGGSLIVSTKNESTTFTRNINIQTGSSTATQAQGGGTGGVLISTGSSTGAGDVYSGNIDILPGSTTGPDGATVYIYGGTSSNTAAATGGDVTLYGGAAQPALPTGSTIALGGNITIQGGNVSGSASFSKTGGSVFIEGGGVGGSGTLTFGRIEIGTSSASSTGGTGAINIGRTGIITKITGTVQLPTVGTSGFVKLGANGQLSADTNTYLTSSLGSTTLNWGLTGPLDPSTTYASTILKYGSFTPGSAAGEYAVIRSQFGQSNSNIAAIRLGYDANRNGRIEFGALTYYTPDFGGMIDVNDDYRAVIRATSPSTTTFEVTSGDIRAPIFYEYNNTAYYLNLNAANSSTAMSVAGKIIAGNLDLYNAYSNSSTGGNLYLRNHTASGISWISSIKAVGASSGTQLSPLGGFAAISNGGIFIEDQNTGDWGGIAISSDACTIWNSADYGYLFRIIDEDQWNATPATDPGTSGTAVNNGIIKLMLDSDGALWIKSNFQSYGSITASGNVTAYSDARLKTNIQTIENSLDKTLKLRGVSYERDGKKNIGVIAQEIREILPEVVHEADDEEKTLSVSYGNVVGLLIEAIKELNAKIEDLQNQLVNK